MERTLYNIDTIDIDGKTYDILIGKNALGNEKIIKISHSESLWMHLSKISSAHIILQSNGDIIPKRYINQVASNIPKNINVIYTQVKNIKLTKIVGSVITKNTKIIKF